MVVLLLQTMVGKLRYVEVKVFFEKFKNNLV